MLALSTREHDRTKRGNMYTLYLNKLDMYNNSTIRPRLGKKLFFNQIFFFTFEKKKIYIYIYEDLNIHILWQNMLIL